MGKTDDRLEVAVVVKFVVRAVVVSVLVALLGLGVGASVASAATFPDVGASDWFYQAVDALSEVGVIQGTGDGTFRPYDTVTRAQFAAMIVRAVAPPATVVEPFEDVYSTDWFQGYVASLYAAGLVSGTTPTTFSPGLGLPRAQAMTLIMRALGYQFQTAPQDGIVLDIDPAEVDAWLAGFWDRGGIAGVHRPAAANAVRLGIVKGTTDGRFMPSETLTRAQAAGLIYRALFQPLTPLITFPDPVPAIPHVTLQQGSTGQYVALLEQRLAALKYVVGAMDSTFDEALRDAVRAFQKVEGLQRDGVVGPMVWERLMLTAATPGPRRSEAGTRVEIDLTRQVLFLISNNQVIRILPVSTGAAATRTPAGHFRIFRKLPYWRESSLGLLYKPSYFYGGIAIHGSYSVPTYPASHGCVRIPYWATDAMYPLLPVGMTVDVYY